MRVGEKNGRFFCEKHGEIVILSARDPHTNGRGALPICMKCQDLIQNKICLDCEKHPATVMYAENQFMAMHGIVDPICKCCQLARTEKFADAAKTQVDKLRGELAVAPCVMVVSTEKNSAVQ